MSKPAYPQNIAVLYGGLSAERSVSLKSGENVHDALKTAGFNPRLYDTGEAAWVNRLIADKPDLVFPVLHGRGGEDGSIQGLLESLGFAYVGSRVLASALAMNKVMSKIFYAQAGIPTAPFYVYKLGSSVPIEAFSEQVVCELGAQLVVKPALEGSSIGMTIVKQAAELPAAIELALSCDADVLIEKFIPGTELTVPVLGNREPRALPVIEITTENECYDYDAKYRPGGSSHIIPARVSETAYHACQNLAVLAHTTLGCAGVSRSDFILDENDQPWLLETNTMPGMTAVSLLPDAASKADIDMPELVSMLVAFATEA